QDGREQLLAGRRRRRRGRRSAATTGAASPAAVAGGPRRGVLRGRRRRGRGTERRRWRTPRWRCRERRTHRAVAEGVIDLRQQRAPGDVLVEGDQPPTGALVVEAEHRAPPVSEGAAVALDG